MASRTDGDFGDMTGICDGGTFEFMFVGDKGNGRDGSLLEGSWIGAVGGGGAGADTSVVFFGLPRGLGAGFSVDSAWGSASSVVVVFRVARLRGRGFVWRFGSSSSFTTSSTGSGTSSTAGWEIGSCNAFSSSLTLVAAVFRRPPRVVLPPRVAVVADGAESLATEAAVEAFGGLPRRRGAGASSSGSTWGSSILSATGSTSGSVSLVALTVERPRLAGALLARALLCVSARLGMDNLLSSSASLLSL